MLQDFLKSFIVLFITLLIIKFLLVIYRIATKKWPASIRFLFSIIDWKIELIKILALMVVALISTFLGVEIFG